MLLINTGPRRQQTLSTFSLKYNCLTEGVSLIGKELSTKKKKIAKLSLEYYFIF